MQENFSQHPQNYNIKNTGTSEKALLSLIFGILSFIVLPFIFGIVAWILGAIELSDIKEKKSSPENRSMAMAGMWLGIINVALVILTIIVIFILILFFAFAIPFVISN